MADDALKIIEWLLAGKKNFTAGKIDSFQDWKKLFLKNISRWESSSDRAVIGGFLADRMAYAFAAGYECAIRRLFNGIREAEIASFCVTESKGQHPKYIGTKIEPISKERRSDKKWILNGMKLFATLADEADIFLIAASVGTGDDNKNMIKFVQIGRDTPGLAIEKMDMPLVPEISHGILRLTNIEITEKQILPGDGYRDYMRPFRTAEDLHVYAGLLGYLFRAACEYGWPRDFIGQILPVVICARVLAARDPESREVIIAAEGVHRFIRGIISSAAPLWQTADEEARNRWERDLKLLQIAETIRVKRLEKAWSE